MVGLSFMIRKNIIALSIIVLNTLLIISISEGIARFFVASTNKTPAFISSEFTMLLPEKNHQATYKRHQVNGGQTIYWKTNSLGLRGDEVRFDDSIRIVVYGDSNIQAVFSDQENTFCARLEFYLNQKQKQVRYQVINAGVQGFGPDQSLIKMTKEIDHLKPHIIILQLFAENDFGDLIRNRIFNLSLTGELAPAPLSQADDSVVQFYQERFKNDKWWHKILAKSALLQLIRNMTQSDVAQAKQLAIDDDQQLLQQLRNEYQIYQNNLPKIYSQFDDNYDLDMILYPDENSSQIKSKLMKAVISRFKKISEEKQIKLFAMVQPSIYDLVHYQPRLIFANYRQDYLADLLSQLAKTIGVPTLNLYPIFHAQSAENLFFRAFDAHWNDQGQDLAAVHYADFILSRLSD